MLINEYEKKWRSNSQTNIPLVTSSLVVLQVAPLLLEEIISTTSPHEALPQQVSDFLIYILTES